MLPSFQSDHFDRIFNASASFFAFEPVLRQLQRMVDVPFAAQLVHMQPPSVLSIDVESSGPTCSLAHAGYAIDSLPDDLRQLVEHDDSQRRALKCMLSQNVVLVQGPPGTGKTHVGVAMCKVALWAAKQQRQRVLILCMCYTNHALDNFLEALLDAGVPLTSLVRLGSSPKISERLKCRTIWNLDRQSRHDEHYLSIDSELQDEEEQLEAELFDLKRELESAVLGPNSWAAARDFLQSAYNDEFEQLCVPGSHPMSQGDYLWQQWLRGLDAGSYKRVPKYCGGIWSLDRRARLMLKDKWEAHWRQEPLEAFEQTLKAYKAVQSRRQCLASESKLQALHGASIIGCTTSAAVNYQELLQDAQPSIVLVEEAGEVLEAQVVSALTPLSQQLILIGDHKQLRPKTKCYRLRVESGQGINLDISLFERLAVSGQFPCSLLTVQHRMPPVLSAIVRAMTYPELMDAPSVAARPPLRGVQHSVAFVDHRVPEGGHIDDEMDSHTHCNEYEVALHLSINAAIFHTRTSL